MGSSRNGNRLKAVEDKTIDPAEADARDLKSPRYKVGETSYEMINGREKRVDTTLGWCPYCPAGWYYIYGSGWGCVLPLVRRWSG